jgi:hypothetical protein
MGKLKDLFRMHEFSLFLFLFSLVILSWPLCIGAKSAVSTFIRRFIAWAAIIVMLFIISRNYDNRPSVSDERHLLRSIWPYCFFCQINDNFPDVQTDSSA